jgi:hypothetical protein
VGFTYTSPCPVPGLDCTVSHPRNAFWKNQSRVCAEFEGEIRIINAGGFEREWLGFGEGDVEGKVELRVRGMLEKVLEDRGVGWEEVEERLKRIRVVAMREWLRRDCEGVVEPNEVEGVETTRLCARLSVGSSQPRWRPLQHDRAVPYRGDSMNNREHKSSSSSSRDRCIPRRFIPYNNRL